MKNHCVMIAVIKKRCRDCNEMKPDSKTDFQSCKNGKMYCTCKVCFNKKVLCEFCNKELNKSYLRSHVKKQHMQHNCMQHKYQPRMQWHIQQQRYNGRGIGSGVYKAPSNAACVGVSGGPSGGAPELLVIARVMPIVRIIGH